jgi:hypothetical protein
LNPTGTALAYATYLGGTNGSDSGNAIAVDSGGNTYVAGSAGSTDFPVTLGAFQTSDGATGGIANAFITKLNATGSSLVYSTYLGGSGNQVGKPVPDGPNPGDLGNAIAVDSAGNAYVAGSARSTDFPVTAGAVQTVNHAAASGGSNAFVAELNPTGAGLLYSTYLGGSGDSAIYGSGGESAMGVAQNGVGKVYVAGNASSADFPTTTGAYETNQIGTHNSFAAMLNLGVPGASELSIAPGSLTLLSPAIGQDSAAKMVTLTNGGTGAVTIQNISIGGTNQAEFAQTNTCGNSLPSGATCTISVTFIPAVAGSRSATLSISDDAPGSPQSVPLTGSEIVYPPQASFSPASLTFTQDVGTTSAPQTSTFSNTGKGPLNITSISLGSGPSGPFSQTNDCGSTVAAGASCTFHVTFTPTGGTENTGIFVSDNQQNSPQVLGLIGLVPASAALTFSPASLTFAPQKVGSTSSAQTITVTNASAERVVITSVTVTGDFSDTTACGGWLAPLQGCMISVSFKPTTAGSRTGMITIADSGPRSPQVIALSGTGTVPGAALSTTVLTFCPQVVGSASVAQTVQLTNSGQAALSITSISASGDFAQSNTCGSTVTAGANCTISVTFTPTDAGSRTGEVTITDNASGAPQIVALSGTGISPMPGVTLMPASLTFAAQNTGSGSSPQTITLTNTGSAALTVATITASGDFAETNTCGATLAAAANCTISVTFTPTQAGAQSGTITVTDSAADSPQTVALSGTGASINLTPSLQNLTMSGTGGTASDTLTISSQYGFSGSLSLACKVTYQGTGNAVNPPTCLLNPSEGQIAASGSMNVTLTVSTTAPAMSANANTLRGAQIFAALLLMGFLRRRHSRKLFLVVLALVLAGFATGCGGHSISPNPVPGTSTGTYQLVVTATSTTVTAATSISLTVN